MGDVIDLSSKRAERPRPAGSDYWQCECGSVTFRLQRDGSVECAGCECESEAAFCGFRL